MIAHAGRYYPILRLLKSGLPARSSILELGSGSIGLGEFYPHSFVGCDLSFPDPPKAPMLPLIASGLHLPFQTGSFDAVIASDVLEHVPPEARRGVIAEALRVARKMAVFGFPSGQRAYRVDQRLFARYQELGFPAPPWLDEHMLYPFPDGRLFEDLDDAWSVRSIGNDNLYFHGWLLRRMMSPRWMRLLVAIDRLPRRLVEQALRFFDVGPCYRRIFDLTRV